METIITLSVVIILAFVVISINKTNIPKKLKTEFLLRQPFAKNLDWTKSKQMYEVTFFDDDKEKKSRYDIDFNWIETKSILNTENLHTDIINTVNKKYPEYELNDISFIENNKGQRYYKIIVCKDDINFMLKINEAYDIFQTRNLTYDKINKFDDDPFFKGNDLLES